ncbi:MAG: hypothetical protein V1809_01920 [Planctomycetota bacterium]
MDTKRVVKAARAGSIQSLGHAGGALRMTARRSIKRSKDSSAEGTPPHTRKGQLRRAILYAVEKDKQTVVVGPDVAIVSTAGMAHEFGGRFRGERYPKRPFMGPALNKTKDRLPKMWASSVKS